MVSLAPAFSAVAAPHAVLLAEVLPSVRGNREFYPEKHRIRDIGYEGTPGLRGGRRGDGSPRDAG